MVAIKTHQADAYLKALDRVASAVLLYGSDAGLVTERAAQLAKRLAERESPPGEIIRLDDADLEGDPDRIFVELQDRAHVRWPQDIAHLSRPARHGRRVR